MLEEDRRIKPVLVGLREDQIAALANEIELAKSRRQTISRAEMIREAIDLWLKDKVT